MITRLVKMEFKPSFIEEFLRLFQDIQPKIAASEGCQSVLVRRDTGNDSVFFTLSLWENESALENYRHSELFKQAWTSVKPNFVNRAEAWSLKECL